MKNAFLLFLTIISYTVSAQAGVTCAQSRFVGPQEVFTLQTNAARGLLSWSQGHFPSLEGALKTANPHFSDRVVSLQASFGPEECATTPRKTLLYHCANQQPGKIQVLLASGKRLILNGKAWVDTTMTRQSALNQGKLVTNSLINASINLEIYRLGSRTLYAADSKLDGFTHCR